MEERPTTVSLVLGAGGARGLAHIGVIRELERRGYRIDAIAGSSMGALIGGIYGMGELDTYTEWVCRLDQTDVLRLLDWTLAGGGLIRGRRIIDNLRELTGERDIEDLDIDFTAVAVDLERGREVWMNRGSLFDAIRASISIPGLFTPYEYRGRTLVDGGLLNPVPVAPTLSTVTDLTVVVDANAGSMTHHPATEPAPSESTGSRLGGLRDFLASFGETRAAVDTPPGLSAVLNQSLETMQAALTRHHLAVFRPDVVIGVPKDACMVYEFHRATSMIELGQRLATETLDSEYPGRHD